jgi:hypothetical protein
MRIIFVPAELGHVHASTKGPDPTISRFRSGATPLDFARDDVGERIRRDHHRAVDAPRSTLAPFFPNRNRFAPQGPLCRNRVISGGDWQASRRSSKGGGSA